MPLPTNLQTGTLTNLTGAAGTTYSASIQNGYLATTGEHDYYQVYLTAGRSYTFHLNGNSANGTAYGLGAVGDTYLTVYDASGNYQTHNDDGGGSLNSLISGFMPSTTGTYYLEVRSFAHYYEGGYQLILDSAVGTNVAPVHETTLTLNGTRNTQFSVNASALASAFRDDDGDALTISGTPTFTIGGTTYNMTYNSSLGTYTYTPTTYGAATVNYTVSDGNGHTASFSNPVTVANSVQANTVTMTRVGDAHTTEDGGIVSYTLASNNPITSGYFDVVVNISGAEDVSEGRIVGGTNTATLSTRTFRFDSTHQSYTVQIQGVQDYDNDGIATYSVSRYAVDHASASAAGTFQSYLRDTFNNGGYTSANARSLSLYNDGDMTSGETPVDRDIPVYLIGDDGRPAEDFLVGNDGGDRLYGGYMIDALHGAIGNDRLYGGYEDDQLFGEAGNDQLYGEQDDDQLYGGDGNDRMDGGIGADLLEGGAGNDTYYVTLADDGTVEDTIIDSAGTADTVYVPFQVESFVAPTGIEIVRMNAGFSNTSITGNLSNNTIVGNAGDNPLNGGGGNDSLNGGAGADSVVGGTGNDVIAGGVGADTLSGGVGSDTFLFNAPLASGGVDRIADFVVVDDAIRLENSVFTLIENAVEANEFRAGAGVTTAATSTQCLIYNSTNGGLYYDTNGATAGGSIQIAILGASLSLTAADFLVA